MPASAALLYFDHNATTPLLPAVADAMAECWAVPYLNPASQHYFGRQARRRLEAARERIGTLVGASVSGRNADTLLFTSGGTEANNLALRGLLGRGDTRGRVVTSRLEHPSITAVADELARVGYLIDHLPVNSDGTLRTAALADSFPPDTRLLVAMLANNETGVVQPVAEIARLAAAAGVPLHVDATQAVGKLPVDFGALGAATMSFAAHKFHGPLGIGMLVVRHGMELTPQLFGGFQQAGLRPGTESVALAVGMESALELWHAEQQSRQAHLQALRDEFERLILADQRGTIVIGAAAPRLPNTSCLAFLGLDRQQLFLALDQAGVACSTGSACASGSSEPSPVLVAMELDDAVISSALRFSFAVTTTAAEVAEGARRILKVCNDLRRRKEA